MPHTNFDNQPLLPGIDDEGGVAVEETKPEEKNVPEIKIKFADPDDGLDEKCPVCGDHGCPQCGGGKR